MKYKDLPIDEHTHHKTGVLLTTLRLNTNKTVQYDEEDKGLIISVSARNPNNGNFSTYMTYEEAQQLKVFLTKLLPEE